MQMVKKGLLILFVAILSLAIFAPKRELYYLIEEELMKNDIIINNEKVHAGLFTLTLKHPEVYFKGIRVAEIGEVKLWTLLFYSTFSIKSISVDASLKRFVPAQIEQLRASHLIFNLMNITINGNGEFGSASGSVNLNERKVHIDFDKESDTSKLKSLLKKGEQGWYYESSF